MNFMNIVVTKETFQIKSLKHDEIYKEIKGKKVSAYGMQRKNRENAEDLYVKLVQFPCHENAKKIFAGGYFIVIYDPEEKKTVLLRDVSGIKSGYYHFNPDSHILYISTNMHSIASAISTDLSKFYTDFLLFQQFVPDGYTIYENIYEVKTGEKIEINIESGIVSQVEDVLPIQFFENSYSESENISLLRDKIIAAHAELVGNDNIIYLSGGIDSCAMLASLHNICSDKVRTVSFRIKGTSQDETVYAKAVADHLGYKIDVIEVDPTNKEIIQNYEDDVQVLNNPIIGNWMFRIPGTTYGAEHYFAGQDTRLHTPSVNKVDQWVISNVSQGQTGIHFINKALISSYEAIAYYLGFYNSSNRKIKYSHLLIAALDYVSYFERRKFQIDPLKYKSWKYDMTNFELIRSYYHLDLKRGMLEREIFNRIVELKWKEQYTDDIRYMVDMGRLVNGNMMMPFYQDELNLFESTIPWKMANKEIEGVDGFKNKKLKVNKYILRKAFEKELPWKIMVRAKAVSLSGYLMLNGVLGNKIVEVLKNDLESSHSFCKRFGHEVNARYIISKQNKWLTTDSYLIIFANYLSCLCLYYKNIIIR